MRLQPFCSSGRQRTFLATNAVNLQSEQGAADKCNQPYRKQSKHAWVTYRLAVQPLWL
jgi:hypothetical protein